MSGWLDHIVQEYGLLAVFAGVAAEGETVTITSGVMAHEGYMRFGPVVVAAALGAYVSDLALYWIGRTYSHSRFVRKAMAQEGVRKVTARLSKNLVAYALTFRFVPGMKTAGAFAIATLGMRPGAFALCAAVSAAVWAVIYVSLGYFLGNAITRLFGDLERIEHALIAPAILGALLWTGVWLRRRRMRGRARPEPAGRAG